MIDEKTLADIRSNIRIYERDVAKLLSEVDRLKSDLANTTRELGFANVRGDLASAELYPPVCRLQFPDGTVPGNAREAAEGWKRLYDESNATVRRIWEVLGIHNYADAKCMSIVKHVADLKRRAELWERLHDHRTAADRPTHPDKVAEHVRLTPRKPWGQTP